jgi:hypothetical protein
MKDKAYILDFNLLAEQDLSIDEFITLLYLNGVGNHTEKYDNYYKKLEEKQFIKIHNEENHITLREKTNLLIQKVEVESLSFVNNKKQIKKSVRLLNNQVNEFIEEFRNKWKGLKPGSMGSPNTCKEKMKRWMSENPEYTPQQILNAADIYINSLNNHTYLQQADYFIYKKEGKDEQSRLSAFIDEVELPAQNWTSELK